MDPRLHTLKLRMKRATLVQLMPSGVGIQQGAGPWVCVSHPE